MGHGESPFANGSLPDCREGYPQHTECGIRLLADSGPHAVVAATDDRPRSTRSRKG
jgi:hypothetical protein